MRKNLHDRILKEEPKEQHLSTVPKSCSNIYTFCGSTYVKVVSLPRKSWQFGPAHNKGI